MKLVDLFAGCGGMSLGFENTGRFEILAAFDSWEPAIAVYRENFEHPMIQLDLSSATPEQITQLGKPDIIIGGPPCQDFSSAGKRDESLGRADLTVIYARLVTKIKPKFFVMENVERAKGSNAFAQAYQIFEKAGYGLTKIVLDASLCGAPQKRKRLFLIGEMGAVHNFLEPTLKANLAKKPMTLRDYFGDSLGVEHYYRHPRSYARRGIFSIDEPSPTVRGVNRPIPKTYKKHPGDTSDVNPEVRPLTTFERSRIQTFPPRFKWLGSKTSQEQMIGNAVPVKLAEYVAFSILKYIESDKVNLRSEIPLRQLSWLD